MMLIAIEVRRRLLNMNTHQSEVFGILTVRLYVGMTAIRWTISEGQVTTIVRYPVYYDDMLLRGDANQIAVRQEALQTATNYIMAHYRGDMEAAA